MLDARSQDSQHKLTTGRVMSEPPTGGGASSVVPGQEQVPQAEDSTLPVNQSDPSSDTDKKKVSYILKTAVVAVGATGT